MEPTQGQEQGSERTRRNILAAAGRLFAKKGYEAVTMREIARAVGRSHTTIYLYFADKEALLYELSAPSLQVLGRRLERILDQTDRDPEERLEGIGREFIRFCLENRSMYDVFFAAGAGRVDDPEPELELNRVRNDLFRLLARALQHCLPDASPDDLLAFSRIWFYLLRGIVATYTPSTEGADALMERLGPTFDRAARALLRGFERQLAANPGPAGPGAQARTETHPEPRVTASAGTRPARKGGNR